MTREHLSLRCIPHSLVLLVAVGVLLLGASTAQAASGANPATAFTSNGVSASVRAVQPAVSGLFQVHAPRAWVDALDESGLPGANGVPDFLDSWDAFQAQTVSAILKNGYAFKTVDSLQHEIFYAGADLGSAKKPRGVTFEFNQNVFTVEADGTPKGERAVGDLRIVVDLDSAGEVGSARFERYSADGGKPGKFVPIALLPGEGCSGDGAACAVANGTLVELGYNATVLGKPERDFTGIQITISDGSGVVRTMGALSGVSGGCVKEVGLINPVCTANDVRLAGVKDVVIATGDTCNLSDPNDTITVQSFTGIFTSGPQRYDIGTYIATDGGGADGARAGSCRRFGFANGTTGLTNLDGDQCADIGAGVTNLEIPNLGPITIKCSDAFHVVNGVVTAGGDGNVDFFHCETWAQQASEINCQSSADIKAGTPSKCGCGLIDAAAGFCAPIDDGNPCTDDICQGICQNDAGSGSKIACTSSGTCSATNNETCRNFTPQSIAKADNTVCGSDPNTNNPCDGVPTCQSGTCTPTYTTAECRPADGECDVAENCTGSSATCPTDAVKGNGVGCTNDGNVCTNDICNGTSKLCTHPAVTDGPRTGCNTAGDQCNNGASCVSGVCQASSAKADGTNCENPSASGGVCDAQDKCESGVCIEKYAASSTVCRASAGTCDVAENCTGSSADCPADSKSTAVCRPSAGDCDTPESCDGVNNNCPADAFLSSATVCRASGGVCDPAESCTGSSAACPGDAKSTALCRAQNGPCDVAENCDGVHNDCPGDAVVPAGDHLVCRAAQNECDAAEECNGAEKTCPADFCAGGPRPQAQFCSAS